MRYGEKSMEVKKQPWRPLRGEKLRLIDGREAVIIEKWGDAWKCINEHDRIEIVYPGQFVCRDE